MKLPLVRFLYEVESDSGNKSASDDLNGKIRTIERLLQPGWDLRVRIAPEGSDAFDIVAHGGVPTTEPAFGKASATLNATPSTMALLLSGRRALNDDSVDIQGDVNIANMFVERLVNS